jgi:hypothetical protein
MKGQVIIMQPDEVKVMFSEMETRLRQSLTEEIRNARTAEVEKGLSAKEISAHLSISTATLWRRFRQGKYPTSLIHRDAGRPKFYISQFEKFIKEH